MIRTSDDIRIGVYVCHCGKNIAGKVDVKRVAKEVAKDPLVTISRDYFFMCSKMGQELIKKDIGSGKINRVVVAACSPKLHEGLFRRVVAEAGLNPGYFEQVNLRELVSWSTEDPNEATEKAIRYVLAGVRKVAAAEPIYDQEAEVINEAVVIGGGVAGITAALDLASKGIKVHLIEKSPTLGGRMALLDRVFPTGDCSLCILTPLMAETLDHPLIDVYTMCEVVEVSGSIGNFTLKVRRNPRYVDPEKCISCATCERVCPVETVNEWQMGLGRRKAAYIPFPQAAPRSYVIDPNVCLYIKEGKCGECAERCPVKAINLDEQPEEFEIKAGAIIIATGVDEYNASNLKNYGYGKYPDVITQLQFESLINVNGPTSGHLQRPSDGKIPRSVVFIQCAGSRDVNNNPYCSNVCCMISLKHAEIIRSEYPDTKVYICYIDMRTPKKGFEELYSRVREEGVIFIRGKPGEVRQEGDHLVVEVFDQTLGKKMEIDADLVVLAAGLSPSEGTKAIREIFNIPKDPYGFLQELHAKLKPVQTSKPGVFICGAAQGPKDIPDSVAQAKAAASEAATILMSRKIKVSGEKAFVDEELCVGCMACRDECPFNAIVEEDGKAKVLPAACAGCGICQAVCPVGAIKRRVYTGDQILNQIEGLLGGVLGG